MITDEQLTEAYARLRSVQKVGRECGVHPSTVHRRLSLIGVVQPRRSFTDADRARLNADYVLYRDHGRLKELAADMGRTVPYLNRQARQIGLTDPSHKRIQLGSWKYMSEDTARMLFDAFKTSPLGVMQWCAKYGHDDEGFRDTMRRYWPDEWDHVVESKAPRSTMYRLGRQVEYRVRDVLKTNGYFVLRSPASKSPVDLVAIKPGQVLMVQCKRGGSLPPKEWNALFDLALSCGCVPVMAERPYPRELRFWRLLARKDGSKRRQPMEPFIIDEIAEAIAPGVVICVREES